MYTLGNNIRTLAHTTETLFICASIVGRCCLLMDREGMLLMAYMFYCTNDAQMMHKRLQDIYIQIVMYISNTASCS